jgi:hypothetical protein
MAAGTILAAWPGERRRRSVEPALETTPADEDDLRSELPTPAAVG